MEYFSSIAYVGPVSVGMNAAHFQSYSGGVFSDSGCDINDMNHGVVTVGYGTENNVPYWLIKNSWGADWGENGYFKMIRNRNQCGIAQDISYPTL